MTKDFRNESYPQVEEENESFLHRALSSFVGKFVTYVMTVIVLNIVLSFFFDSRFALSTFISMSGFIGCIGHLINFSYLYVSYETAAVPHVWVICALLTTLMFFRPI